MNSSKKWLSVCLTTVFVTVLHLATLEKLLAQEVSSDALSCYKLAATRSWNQARPSCEAAANKGDAHAQLLMGESFRLRANLEQAVSWYLLAAAQDHAEANYQMSKAYFSGEGVAKDHKAGLRYITHAAKLGFAEAQFVLAQLLEEGKLVDKDVDAAIRWYREAALNGNAPSQFRLAILTRNNDANAPEGESSISLLKLAAVGGVVDAQYQLGLYLLTSQRDEAVFWLTLAGKNGNRFAYLKLADYFLNTDGSTDAVELAKSYATLAMRMGSDDAYELLRQARKKNRATASSGKEKTPQKKTAETTNGGKQKKKIQAKASKQVSVNKSQSIVSVAPLLKSGDWLLSQNKSAYTIQLLASQRVDDLGGAVTQLGIQEQASVYATQRKAGKTYVLIMGSYSTLTQAQEDANELQSRSSWVKPWVRKFSQLTKKYVPPPD